MTPHNSLSFCHYWLSFSFTFTVHFPFFNHVCLSDREMPGDGVRMRLDLNKCFVCLGKIICNIVMAFGIEETYKNKNKNKIKFWVTLRMSQLIISAKLD